MTWGLVATAGASLIGGAMSSRAANRGADAQAEAARLAQEEQARQYDQTRQDLMPWLNTGGWALGQRQNFLQGDYTAALNSPDYQAALQEGFKGLDRGAASRGNLWGGGMDADRMRLGQNLASQQIGNYDNRLAGLSSTGQTAGTTLGQFGQNFGQQTGENAMNSANARASSYAAGANAWGNALGGIAGAFGQWQGGRG